MFNRLSNRLVLVIIFVALFPLIIVGVTLTLRARDTQRAAAVDIQEETALRLAEEIETFITDRPRELRLLADVRGFVDLPLEDQRSVLSEMLAFDQVFEDLALLDAQGLEVVHVSRRAVATPVLRSRAGEDAYSVPVTTGEVYYSPVQIDEGTGELLMTISYPLTDLRTGQIAGVLVGDFRLRAVTTLLLEQDFRAGQDIFVVSAGEVHAEAGSDQEHGSPEIVVAHRDSSVVLSRTTFETHDLGTTSTGLQGDEVVVGLARFSVGAQQFTVVSELTTQEAYREANQTLYTLIGVLLGVLLLTAVGGFIFAQRVARPVVQLAGVAERIGGGELEVEADVRGSQEIVTLATAFNSMTSRLRETIGSLEERVAARTQDLFLTLEVGQLSARIYQQAELLPRVADFIRERFDLYYTQIYLVDEAGRHAYLEAGTGEVGRQLLARRHRLDLSQTSIVARTYQTQRPVLVANTLESDIHMPNPLLPETRSEVAIPLIVGDQILGILDMQAREADTFRQDNLPVFEAMANQLASALRSAQAYEQTQNAINRADEINRRLTGEAWTRYLGQLTHDKRVGYRYDLQDVEPITEPLAAQEPGSNGRKHVHQPLLLRDEPIGTIQIVEDEDREWSADDMMLIEAVADRVALALEQFRAFDETQSALDEMAIQAQRLALLNELAAEISAAETLAEVYRIVATRTDMVLGSDRASIALLTPTGTELEIYGLDGVQGAIPLGTTLPRAGTWIGEVLDSRRARSLSDMAEAAYPETQELVEQGLRSSMNAPLIVHGRPVGTLNVARTAVNAYGRRDEDLLTQIASLLSAQIENRGLLEQAQKRASEMQTVAEVGAEATSALDPDQLLWMVTNLVRERFGLYHAHIYLLDESGQRLMLSAGAGDVGERMVQQERSISLDHERSLVARAARTRQGLLVNDVTQASDFLPNPMLPHTRSELAMPLVAGNQLVGVLDVQSNQIGWFSDEDLRVHGTLAAQIAASVQNARLFADAQERLAIIESSDDLIAMSDMESNLVFINPAGARLLGYENVDEFQTFVKNIDVIYPPEGLERVQNDGIREVLEGSGLWRGENVLVHQDGMIIPVEQTIFALYDDEGKPRNLATIMTDIRERKAAQEDLDNERRTLQTLLANLPVGVFMADAATGTGLLANDAALEMLGRGLDPASATTELAEIYEAYQVGTDELYPVDRLPLVRGMSGESARIDDMEIRRPDGRKIFLEVSGAPITDASGHVTASVAVFSDITERRRAEEERLRLLEETEKRAGEMQTVAEVGAEASATLDPDRLLQIVSDLVKERFDLYHAHVYLLDDDGQNLRLAAGAGDIGQMMVDAGHQISATHEFSLVARAARTREGVLVNDVTDAATFLPNPMLPGTRSEMAIPMIVGNQLLGVLDVQSEQVGRFNPNDIQVQSVLAAQVAVAVQNARSFRDAQQRLAIIETATNAIFLVTPDLDVIYANPATAQMLEYEPDELLTMNVADFQGPEMDRIRDEIVPVLVAGQGWHGESVFVRKDGVHIPVEMTPFAILDENGQPQFFGNIAADITERKAAQAELDSQRRTLETLLENLPVGVFMAEAGTGRPLQVNSRALDMLGRGLAPDAQTDELAQIYAAYKFGTDQPYPSDEMPLVRGMRGEAVNVDDMEVRHPNGTRVLLEVTGAPIRDASGQVTASVAVFTDITERRRAEQERLALLDELQHTSDALAERIQELAALQDVGAYGEENLALEEYLTRVANRIPASMRHTDVAVAAIEFGGELYGDMRALDAPVRLINDLEVGDEVYGRLMVGYTEEREFAPEENPHLRDIASRVSNYLENRQLLETTLKRALEMQAVAEVGAEAAASLETTKLLKAVSELTKERFELYHAHVYLLDEEGRNLVLQAGAGAAGDMMVRGGHRIPLAHQQSLVVQAALTRQPVIANDVTQTPNFLPNPMLPQTKAELATPMIAGGEVIGVLDVQSSQPDYFGDEDVQVQLTLASQVAVAVQNARLFSEQVAVADQLREVDRLKSEFLASMSHELRTPLNSIIGYAEVLLDGIDGDLTGDMEEDVGAIHGSGKHLLNLINDILDLAKIEAGQMDLVIEDFDLTPVAEDMANTNRILLKDKSVGIVLDIPEDLPKIHADSLRIRQVISNLLANAIKFTEEGDITLKARPSTRYTNMVEVAIIDSGIGMNEQQLKVIFDRFRQVDQSHTRRAGGTGLGLSITRQLIEMHGGEIWVESEPGVGSTFIFTLPFAQAPVTG